jgi:hypothetical protein
MRKTKASKVADKNITVMELRVKDVLEFLEAKFETGDLISELKKWLPRFTTLTIEDAKEMAPSEFKILWSDFKEVNADFFEIADRLGIKELAARLRIKEMLIPIREKFIQEFSARLADSLKRGTPGSGTMGIPRSRRHWWNMRLFARK